MESMKIPKFLAWEEFNSSHLKKSPIKSILIPLIYDRTKKNLMEAPKFLSSRARKRWIQQGSVQFQEPTHIHLNYASYPEESLKNPMKISRKKIFKCICYEYIYICHKYIYIFVANTF